MNIKEFKQWWNRFEYSGNFPEPKAEHINLLLAEVNRLTADLAEKKAECERLKSDFAYVEKCFKCTEGCLLDEKNAEVTRLESLAASRQDEIERLDRVFHNQGNLREQIFDLQLEITRLNDLIGNTRLADQEAIERHTAKMVAGEIMAEIDDLDTETDADFYLCGYIAANSLRYRIRKKYGVTE